MDSEWIVSRGGETEEAVAEEEEEERGGGQAGINHKTLHGGSGINQIQIKN